MTLPPIPPSDNLYKFTAIGGLILVVLSLYFPWKMKSELKIETSELEWEWAQWSLEFKETGAVLEQVDKKMSRFMSSFIKELESNDSKPLDAETLKNFWNALQHRLKEIEGLQPKLKQLGILKAKIENAIRKRDIRRSQAKALDWISNVTLGMGVIMALIGFLSWYFRFQIYQDQIVKAQAEQWTKPKTQDEQEKEEIPG